MGIVTCILIYIQNKRRGSVILTLAGIEEKKTEIPTIVHKFRGVHANTDTLNVSFTTLKD